MNHRVGELEKKEGLEIDPLTLGGEEVKELARIFEPSHEIKDSLFSKDDLSLPDTATQVPTDGTTPMSISKEFPDYYDDTKAPFASIKELEKLAKMPVDKSRVPRPISADEENGLEDRIHAFQKEEARLTGYYLESFHQRGVQPDYCLYVFDGWNTSFLNPASLKATRSTNSLDRLAFSITPLQMASGGFFVRWNGRGIVINPGRHFLENFHQQGLHIRDIHFVFVTKDHPEAYANIREIYTLNYRLNKLSPEFHLIHYYLNQQTHHTLSKVLKPNFKQERHAVHCLELFLDSPDVEKIELTDGIVVHYFSAGVREDLASETFFPISSLGIKLDLKSPEAVSGTEKNGVRLGYLSGASWSPLVAHHLGHCDVLIAGFGTTSPNDYNKIHYNSDCLGYFGTFSLLEEICPPLLLCCEFEGKEGDIRIEVVKKMREEYTSHSSAGRAVPVILPGDNGLFVDLRSLGIQCSISQVLVDPAKVCLTKSAEMFGKLQYLSPECWL